MLELINQVKHIGYNKNLGGIFKLFKFAPIIDFIE